MVIQTLVLKSLLQKNIFYEMHVEVKKKFLTILFPFISQSSILLNHNF